MILTTAQRRYRRLKKAGLCVNCESKRGRRGGKAYCRPCLDHFTPDRAAYAPRPPVHRARVPIGTGAPRGPRATGTLAARRRAIGLCPCGDTDPIDGTCAGCKVAA